MVCVTTSRTLLGSVLDRAGSSIRSQYERSRSKNFVLTDGGRTSAKKILFVSWELEVRSPDTVKVQKVNKIVLLEINQILFVIIVII